METPRSRAIFAKVSPFLIRTHAGFVEEEEGAGVDGAGVGAGVEMLLAEGIRRMSPA